MLYIQKVDDYLNFLTDEVAEDFIEKSEILEQLLNRFMSF